MVESLGYNPNNNDNNNNNDSNNNDNSNDNHNRYLYIHALFTHTKELFVFFPSFDMSDDDIHLKKLG